VFAHRSQAERVLLFHHDPLHSDDFLDALGNGVGERLGELGKPTDWVELAKERSEITLEGLGSVAPATMD